MAPAQIPVFLSQQPSTENDQFRDVVLRLAWQPYCTRRFCTCKGSRARRLQGRAQPASDKGREDGTHAIVSAAPRTSVGGWVIGAVLLQLLGTSGGKRSATYTIIMFTGAFILAEILVLAGGVILPAYSWYQPVL